MTLSSFPKCSLIAFFILFCFPLIVLPQDGIRFQAVARDNSGQVLANQSVDVRLTVIKGSLPGTNEYQETHSLTTDLFGLFTLSIGQGSPTLGTFAGITWPDGLQRHLKVELNIGAGYVDLGTTEFVSVPLSIHSETAEVATNMYLNDLKDVSASPIANEFLKWNGSQYVPANGIAELHRSDNTYTSLQLTHIGNSNGGANLRAIGNQLYLTNRENGLLRMGTNDNLVFVLDQYGNLGLGDLSGNAMNDLHIHRNASTTNFLQFSHGGPNPLSSDGMVVGLAAGSSDGVINHRQNKPIHFYTNDLLRMTLEASGGLTINNLAGTGTRMVTVSAGGTLGVATVPVNTDNQTLGLSGTTLSISGGNNVDLGSLPDDSDWIDVGSVVYNTTANIGIGTASPQGRLHVNGPTGEENPVFYFTPANTSSGDSSTLFLGEDHDASYGMGIRYDGSGNELEIFGKSITTEYGPHLTIARDNGNITVASLAGTGTRNVVVDANGKFSAQSNQNHIMISDRDFEPSISSASFIRSIGAGLEGTYLTTNSAMTFVAPVQLPQGAHPQSMIFYYYDLDPGVNLRAALYRRNMGGGTYNAGLAISSGSPGNGTATVSFGTLTVDNTDEVWELRISVTGGSPNNWPGNSNLKFKGVSITYQNP